MESYVVMRVVTYIKVFVKGTSASKGDSNFRFVPQVTAEDAVVDVLFLLLSLDGNGVKLFQDGNIVRFAIVKVDGEERNPVRRVLVFKPSESWHIGGQRSACLTKVDVFSFKTR